MPVFQVQWTAEGTAEVEADNATEAGDIVQEGIQAMDVTMFESWDVTVSGAWADDDEAGPDDDG